MSAVQTIYGLHAVRATLMRHPQRVRVVRLARERDDARMREIESLARRQGCRIERLDAHALKQMASDVAHQGALGNRAAAALD